MNPRLHELEKLEENWDSYGASKIGKAALETTQKFLDLFDSLGFPEPYPIPSPDGGIDLEWHSGGTEVSFDISKEGELVSAFIFDGITNYEIPTITMIPIKAQ